MNSDKKLLRRNMQEELSQRKTEKETDYFWSLVERNRRQNKKIPILSREQEEKLLFGSQSNAGIKFDTYDSIPVEKSGPNADSVPPISSFHELTESLPDFLIANLERMKYEIPTPIQKYAIPLALNNFDLMCSAQTGSGKTCAFLFPMITSINSYIESTLPNSNVPRYQSSLDDKGVHPLAVVLAPTRELAAQIHLESKKICYGSQLRSLVLYGGSEIRSQLSELSFGCDIVIATPGRLIDIIDRGIISLSEVKCLILDEADRMLDMGFEPQIREIVQMRDMPEKESRQTLMFSATFKPDIQKLASEFLVDYIWIGVGRVGSTVQNIKQNIVLSTPEASVKLQLTVDAINATTGRTLIFVQMKRTASWLCETLRNQFRIRVDDIHSDKSQMQRETSLKRFRDGQVRVLVGTDVAARGLDIPDVAHVIQYDLPHTPDEFDTFVHRVGRTGRAGHTGIATSLFVPGSDGDGNSRIAPLMLRLLQETEQDIPEWFRSMAQQQRSSNNGRGNIKQKTWQNSKYGGKDQRSNYSNYRSQNQYQSQNNYYNNNNHHLQQQQQQHHHNNQNGYNHYNNNNYHQRTQQYHQSYSNNSYNNSGYIDYDDYADYDNGYITDVRYSTYGTNDSQQQQQQSQQSVGYQQQSQQSYYQPSSNYASYNTQSQQNYQSKSNVTQNSTSSRQQQQQQQTTTTNLSPNAQPHVVSQSKSTQESAIREQSDENLNDTDESDKNNTSPNQEQGSEYTEPIRTDNRLDQNQRAKYNSGDQSYKSKTYNNNNNSNSNNNNHNNYNNTNGRNQTTSYGSDRYQGSTSHQHHQHYHQNQNQNQQYTNSYYPSSSTSSASSSRSQVANVPIAVGLPYNHHHHSHQQQSIPPLQQYPPNVAADYRMMYPSNWVPQTTNGVEQQYGGVSYGYSQSPSGHYYEQEEGSMAAQSYMQVSSYPQQTIGDYRSGYGKAQPYPPSSSYH